MNKTREERNDLFGKDEEQEYIREEYSENPDYKKTEYEEDAIKEMFKDF